MGSDSRVMAKVGRGDNLFKIVTEKPEFRRGKCENEQAENSHPKSGVWGGGKRVILVYGP